MTRSLVFAAAAFVVMTGLASAQQVNRQGVVKAVDPDKKTITITADGKDEQFKLTDQTKTMGLTGKTIVEQLQNLKVGATVTFRPNKEGGTLFGLRAGAAAPGGKPGGARTDPPAPTDLTKLVPLTDLGTGKYRGFEGGLYPGGSNARPEKHEAAGLALAKQIQPLGPDGNPAPDGKIVLLCVGMSNTTMEFTAFMRVANADKDKNPNVVLVDGAQSGQTAFKTQDPKDNATGTNYWRVIGSRIKQAGVTPQQVQAIWIKQADAYPTAAFPKHAEVFRDEMRKIMQNMHTMYPNLKIVYLSSRTYGGYAKTRLNPEPFAYEEGLSVKWLIEEQVKGDPALNFNPEKGEVKAPWLCWGPYLWTRGTTKRADGESFAEEDFRENDRTHPSPKGQEKVAGMLLTFLKTDATAKLWFVKSQAKGKDDKKDKTEPPGAAIPADVELQRDVTYGKGGDVELKMDIYRPKVLPKEPMPVLVYIHGGGWSMGSKDKSADKLVPYVQRGYCGVSINYRLTPSGVQFPEPLYDCKCAIRFLRAKAKDLHLDPDHIGAWGHSSGGHLVALLGTTAHVKEFEGTGGWQDQSSRVQAVCAQGAVTDFLKLLEETMTREVAEPNIKALLGGHPKDHPEQARLASPLTHITKDAASFIIVHGEADPIVPLSQAEMLHKALKGANVPVQLQIGKGSNHGYNDHKALAAFLDANLKPGSKTK